LPSEFLTAQLSGKLPLVTLPCILVDDATWTVHAKPVDYSTARRHLSQFFVRFPSEQLDELVREGSGPEPEILMHRATANRSGPGERLAAPLSQRNTIRCRGILEL